MSDSDKNTSGFVSLQSSLRYAPTGRRDRQDAEINGYWIFRVGYWKFIFFMLAY